MNTKPIDLLFTAIEALTGCYLVFDGGLRIVAARPGRLLLCLGLLGWLLFSLAS